MREIVKRIFEEKRVETGKNEEDNVIRIGMGLPSMCQQKNVRNSRM